MIKNFFLTAFRNAFKNWTYSIINILGLSVGLAAIIYISLFVQFELGYDKFHENAEQIYRICLKGRMMNNDRNQAITPAPMAETMRNDYPEVLNTCRINRSGDWLIVYGEKKINEKNFLFADSTFFDVFSFNLLKGDPKNVLTEPRSVVMTETGAKKYFGNEDPIGKLLRVESDTILYKVTGLMEDLPENSHFHFDLLGSLTTLRASKSTTWVSHRFYTYILLRQGTEIEGFEEKMQLIIEKYVGPQVEQILGITMEDFEKAGNTLSYYIQPLLDIHLHSDLQFEIETNGNILYVYIFISIAIFILVIASINFTNLATAKAANRSKEVGIKKVVGAMKKQLVFQFLTESFIITLVSLVVAIIVLEMFMTGLNNLVQIPLKINYLSYWFIPSLLLLIFTVSIMAGSYPAFFLASLRPVAVLKGKLKIGVKGGVLRSVLVIIQFVVSVFILLSTYTVSDQLNYLLNKDLGFDKENILMINRSDALKNQMEAFKFELKKFPSVINVTNGNAYPGVDFTNIAHFLGGESTANTYFLHKAWVSYDYGKTFGFELVEGRFFSRDFSTDSNAIVINEAAVKYLGLEEPIGKIILAPVSRTEFVQCPIIGVVKDFNFKSLHKTIEPAVFTLMHGNWEGVVCVKLKPENINSSISQIKDIWESFSSDYPFEYFFFDDHLKGLYKAEQRTNSIFILFSVLSILISFMGLLGLISFITEQRKKEIGIRKTFGSSSGNIVFIISKEILKLIIVASVISWPIAYWVMNNWLQDFSFRVDINYFMFIIIPILTIILSLLTVIYQTVKAAMKNPVETIRYE